MAVKFVEVVMLTRLCIKSSLAQLDGLLYFWLLTILVIIKAIMIGYVKTACWILDQANKPVLAVKLKTWFPLANHPSKQTKYQIVGFLVAYKNALILRVLDAILIVDYEK